MATAKKGCDATWFYHAPCKKQEREPVSAPPPSQIPGLSQGLDQATSDDQHRMWIKDTDSPYIRLAKQGGHPDLLRFRSPKPRSDCPQGYPRCDWYYHEDQSAAEADPQDNIPHEFTQPDYMVHHEWPGRGPSGSCGGRKRGPFAYDEEQVYSRELNPTDKTVKLPELKPSGYGTRAEKMENRKHKHKCVPMPKPIRQESELDQGKMKYKPVPKQENGDVVMHKLLSHGYKKEWDQQRDVWEERQKKVQDKFDSQNHIHYHDKFQTEYQEKMATSPTKQMATAGVGSRRGAEHGKSHKSEPKGCKTPEKELFKLSKFKNVPSKTKSYRNQQMHGHSPIVHDLDPVEPTVARPVPAAV